MKTTLFVLSFDLKVTCEKHTRDDNGDEIVYLKASSKITRMFTKRKASGKGVPSKKLSISSFNSRSFSVFAQDNFSRGKYLCVMSYLHVDRDLYICIW